MPILDEWVSISSQSVKGLDHCVSIFGRDTVRPVITCDCESYRYRGRCRHQLEAMEKIEQEKFMQEDPAAALQKFAANSIVNATTTALEKLGFRLSDATLIAIPQPRGSKGLKLKPCSRPGCPRNATMHGICRQHWSDDRKAIMNVTVSDISEVLTAGPGGA